jgi:SSS family solute:Na+ symporter/sodium/proline symporter
MLSVAYLDVGNGFAMLAGVTAAVLFLVFNAGGPGPALDALRPDQLALFGTLDPIADAGALFLPTMLLLMGEANMYQKFSSAKDEGAARRAVIGWIVGTIIIEVLIVAVGVFGSVAVPGLSVADSEAIVIRVASTVLPPALGIMRCHHRLDRE